MPMPPKNAHGAGEDPDAPLKHIDANTLYPKPTNCPVPECSGGYVRVPEFFEEVVYGHVEKYVRFIEVQCGECKGTGKRP